jgi:Ca2+-binding RTX toxin-like protein
MPVLNTPIFWSREQERYANDEAVDNFVNHHSVRIVSTLDTFEIPENPTWSEDPFSSRVWSAYYQSLGWLYAGEEAFKRGQFDDFPEYAKSMILDFMTDNNDVNNPTHRLTYHDGANAFRLATISYLYDTFFKEGNAYGVTFTPQEYAVFNNSLDIQRDQVLYQLSREDHWEDNNHRFFHSMALASYASVFGTIDTTNPLYEPHAQEYFDKGLDIVQDTLASIIFTDDGVTAEQSFTYHRLAIGLVLEAVNAIESAGYTMPVDYSDLLKRMYEFDLLAARPDHGDADLHVSEIGDTYYNGMSGSYYINLLNEAGVTSPTIEWIKTEGLSGTRPTDLNYFSEAGYIIVRPEYEWENARDLRLVVDASPARHSHGHYDNSNILLSLYGENILVDSGGPYSYDNKNDLGYDFTYSESIKEFYFTTSEAHNIVVVDGFSSDGDTRVDTVVDNDQFSYMAISRDFLFVPDKPGPAYDPANNFDAYVAAVRASYDNITLTRNIIVLKDAGITLVFDTIDNHGTQSHDYELNWHFDPAAMGVDAANNTEFSINGVQIDAAFASSEADTTYTVLKGVAGDEMQGWVTTKLYSLTPAPVLEMKAEDVDGDAWFASAFAGSLNASDTLDFTTNKTTDGYTAHVTYRGVAYDVMIDATGAHITQTGAVDTTRTITGTDNAERLLGTVASERMFGLGGNDQLYGYGEKDTLSGGDGNDTLIAGEGNDSVTGDAGDDLINGDAGIDTINGGNGNDRIYGGDNSDKILGDMGNDYISGDKGNDTISGGDDADTLWGGNGLDVIHGDAGNDFIRGQNDNDQISGDDGTDKIYGELGDDTLNGGAGNDTASGGAGNDVFLSETGNDLLTGGDGDDTFYIGAGSDRYYGDAGMDTLIVAGISTDFLIVNKGAYIQMVDKNIGDGDMGSEALYSIEHVQFTDTTLSWG